MVTANDRNMGVGSRRDFDKLLLAVGGMGLCLRTAFAQKGWYPTRGIRVVVPFVAGGGVDVFGRLIADQLKNERGVSVVIDNRSGANGAVGANEVRRAEPDGSTVLMSASTHILMRQMMRNVPFDPVLDFTPIARVGNVPLLLVMSPNRPQATIAEVVADARKDPTRWTFGMASLGSAAHIATIAFSQIAKLDLVNISYRGTAGALNDVAGDHIQLMFGPLSALLPMARNGSVKALAVISEKRSALAPDIPTVAESGLPGLNVSIWYGMWGPLGLANDVVSTLNALCTEAVRDLEAQGRLEPLGIEPVSESPDEFRNFILRELELSIEFLRAANFQPQ